MVEPFARSRGFWRLVAVAALVGLLSGVAAVAFILAEESLLQVLWGDDHPTGFGGLPWIAVPIVGVGAVLVGLQRHWSTLRPPDPNFVDEMVEGHTEPRTALQLVLIGLTSIVSGASLGPEAPVATAGAGVGTWVGSGPTTAAGRPTSPWPGSPVRSARS